MTAVEQLVSSYESVDPYYATIPVYGARYINGCAAPVTTFTVDWDPNCSSCVGIHTNGTVE
jgi:hypothetical protein